MPDPSTPISPQAPPAAPDRGPRPGAEAVMPQMPTVSLEALGQSVTNDPATHLRRGTGYRYERAKHVNDNQLALEQAKVRALQTLLKSAGADIEVDGLFGPKTEAALKEVQKKLQLPDTGVLDAKTMQALAQAIQGAAQAKGATPASGQPGQGGDPQAGAGQGRQNPYQQLEDLTRRYAAAGDPNSPEAVAAYAQIRNIISRGTNGAQLAAKLDNIQQTKGMNGVVSVLSNLISRHA